MSLRCVPCFPAGAIDRVHDDDAGVIDELNHYSMARACVVEFRGAERPDWTSPLLEILDVQRSLGFERLPVGAAERLLLPPAL
jgi:hypothetical protein